jgi:hypothetical protein
LLPIIFILEGLIFSLKRVLEAYIVHSDLNRAGTPSTPNESDSGRVHVGDATGDASLGAVPGIDFGR